MHIAVVQTEEQDVAATTVEEKQIPEVGTIEWIYYLSELEGRLPSPINVSITGSTSYSCPELKWYNFDVYPHKVKLTNTGYTVLIGAKWKAERPYLEGGPLLGKHILSQIHFHWGASMMEGSDHTVDKRRYPGEMQVTYFKSDYLTQEEALKHDDGVLMVCYMIKEISNKDNRTVQMVSRGNFATGGSDFPNLEKYGVNPDDRLSWVLEGFPRIQEAQTNTRIGPYPMCRLLPMFYEDYFMYWGSLTTVRGVEHVIRWLIPRTTLFASLDQMKQFRKLWNPWDEPNLQNFRPLKERGERHVFFFNRHWCQYNSLLPIPRIPESSISVLSPAYEKNLLLLPPQNAYMLPESENKENNTSSPQTKE